VAAEHRADLLARESAIIELAEVERRATIERKRIDLDELLIHLVEVGGSDLHLTAGSRPAVRRNGQMMIIESEPMLTSEKLRDVSTRC